MFLIGKALIMRWNLGFQVVYQDLARQLGSCTYIIPIV